MSASSIETQVLVLGAGPGGYTAAFRAADLGLRTVLVERYPTLGGVCLNVGCIPSKALLHTAEVIDGARELGERGVAFESMSIDRERLSKWKDKVVAGLTRGLSGLAKQRKVQVVHGNGRFVDPHRLVVESERGSVEIAFERAIIAAGSRPALLPGLPEDDPRVMDSTKALALDDIPSRLLVVGGGIIGLEMATVYAALGSWVSVVEWQDGLLPGTDRDLVKPLEDRLRKRLESIRLATKTTEVVAEKEGIRVAFQSSNEAAASGGGGADEALFDRVLVAIGRRPNGHLIGAQAAGVKVDERGFIPVDDGQRTNIPHIHAIGDIAGEPMLAHKATHEGKTAAEICAGHKVGMDARAIPSVAYTDPEVAWTGLGEGEAKAKGIEVEKAVFPWAASGRALGIGRKEGFTKLLFEPGGGRLLGAGIVGPHAGDLIAQATLAIEMGADAQDIALTIHPHPTLSETLNFAAEIAEGTITDLYLPRRT
ncbi:dihydrolipoyl dehydrogenase [Thioalkalivibrio sp. HK1]|uniref:dihydrolipoyl dehydrogenase n=1 Tax=Thioalkalivibrio sp. HK1 TaxID=1469245 RepID=UPI00047256B3|nr:dihydrolipoyl dehydrogenase [Thioalkalivibrio sp. HK1]